mmetsp:Transcript_8758/g.10019  ORF Transcript_8758/g.10019 Transcript_8758/m.10019 type:complete len:136 (+) Transcript_8758:173-580(+)
MTTMECGSYAEALRSLESGEESIIVQTNHRGNENDFKLLLEKLVNCDTCSSLDFSGNYIGEGTALLCDVLKRNSKLSSLNLLNNSIGPNQARNIAELLKLNDSLLELRLGQNPTETGAVAIADALKVNQSLRILE